MKITINTESREKNHTLEEGDIAVDNDGDVCLIVRDEWYGDGLRAVRLTRESTFMSVLTERDIKGTTWKRLLSGQSVTLEVE